MAVIESANAKGKLVLCFILTRKHLKYLLTESLHISPFGSIFHTFRSFHFDFVAYVHSALYFVLVIYIYFLRYSIDFLLFPVCPISFLGLSTCWIMMLKLIQFLCFIAEITETISKGAGEELKRMWLVSLSRTFFVNGFFLLIKWSIVICTGKRNIC